MSGRFIYEMKFIFSNINLVLQKTIMETDIGRIEMKLLMYRDYLLSDVWLSEEESLRRRHFVETTTGGHLLERAEFHLNALNILIFHCCSLGLALLTHLSK